MIRQTANDIAKATPATLFNTVGWDGLPPQIQQAMAVAYGSVDNAKAGLFKSNLPLVNLFAVYAMGIKGDATAQTMWVAQAPKVWQDCMIQVTASIVDGEAAPLVKLIANGLLSDAAADGWESQRKAAEVISAGATAAAAGLTAAVKALDGQIESAKAAATSLFDAWRSKVPANYMALATDSVQTFESTPNDAKFLRPLLKPDPLGRGAFDPSFPEPYQDGFKTAANPAPFAPRVSFLSGGQQLAPKQRILAKLDPKAAAIWNDAVRPAIQTLLDLYWLRKEAKLQENWQVQSAAIYAKKIVEFAANAKTQAGLSAKVKADVPDQLSKLPAFAVAVIQSAGTKLGKALAAAKFAEDAYAIQKLAIIQTENATLMARFAQALQAVKIQADGLTNDVAAKLQEIGKANIPAADALTEAGRIQSETAGKGIDLVNESNKPPETTIDAAVGGSRTGRTAGGVFKKAGERGENMRTNGNSITATNQDSADTLNDPSDPPPPVEEPKSNALLWVVGLGIAAKLLLR